MPGAGVAPLPGTFTIQIDRRRAVCTPIDPPSEATCPRCATFRAREWTFAAADRDHNARSRRLCIDCGITTLFQDARKEAGW